MTLGAEEWNIIPLVPIFIFGAYHATTLGAEKVAIEGTEGVVVVALVMLGHKGMTMGALAAYLTFVGSVGEADDMLTMTTILTVNCAGTRYMLEA